ncbi:TetR/AcrR family transcriptional regulator [Hespellia stercorisuis]|uniref:Transcriptional regulator, TetR family n=1 Tax=Hespellia stercorisuis DSM 15480 TaxID=1121950 RepID=A0A1M6RUM4_9FIRM|nr:TetR/AcrR family transcriptional regulator [Hespellia stercorisuis]SHK36232.1 transcriptional regulator, TetR family [Hespellia stercorisuis DSM 15480]
MGKEETQERQEQKRQNTIRFIKATQELLDEEGLDALSIRKIADRAGFHNSTLYLYFNDVNQLILMASLKYFDRYSKALSQYSYKKLTPTDNFYTIWEVFCRIAFQRPQIFYNFFFGKYSDNLTEIMKSYYELFPDEVDNYSKEIGDMYYGKDFKERCRIILMPLIDLPDSHIHEDNVELANTIVVSCFKELLTQKCQDPELSDYKLTEEFLSMLTYITGLKLTF